MKAPEQEIEDLEYLLQQRTAELQEIQKELEGLMYSISHDLRAPLRHIRGYAQIVAEDCGEGLQPECRQHLRHIEESAQKVGGMLDALLQLSRLSRRTLHSEKVAFEELVNSVVVDLASKAGARDVEWKIAALPVVECDPVLARQLFEILLENALKFTAPRPRGVIEVGSVSQGPQQLCFVRDNGIGFDMKYADKLFSMFQRLHSQQDFPGEGVGLALAQRIVHRHGGRIWAEAEPEKGATFFFTFTEGCSQNRQ
jgi:light-regulated signal transduction histidine kinase (bacteriophytochrome)